MNHTAYESTNGTCAIHLPNGLTIQISGPQTCGKTQFFRRIVDEILPTWGGPQEADTRKSAPTAAAPFRFESLREANVARQAVWCKNGEPDLSFRANELGGEVGEAIAEVLELTQAALRLGAAAGAAQNVAKKRERERHGWAGSRATVEALAAELADVIVTVDLVALKAGIDLAPAVIEKFNATSKKVGIPVYLAPTEPEKKPEATEDVGPLTMLPNGQVVYGSADAIAAVEKLVQALEQQREVIRHYIACARRALNGEVKDEKAEAASEAFAAGEDDSFL